jgi:serine/threonine protein kinase/Flp pilus assembly protein TadD
MGAVVDEYLDRLARGERPDVEEYALRHPELAAVLRHMLPALRAMHQSGADRPAGGVEPEGSLGDFRIVREVGRGGMGVVYEAVQVSLGRPVALKVLPFAAALDARQLWRFKNEAQAAALLHHQNIVPVYAVGCERGLHYYAMQFIDGQTVAALIGDLRPLAGREPEEPGGSREQATRAETVSQPAPALTTARSTTSPAYFRAAARLAAQAAEALEHAHRQGVVHRDVKPANLLVDGQGNLWVTDFGLARVQSEVRLTVTGDLVGTLRYMSPEQALAQPIGVDHRTDLYSLGATLYELLTLEPAFDGRDRQELLRQIGLEEPRPPRRVNRAVPAELETIVLKAMAKNRDERYATARELADDLGRFLRDEPIRARRPTLVQKAKRWLRRHRPAVWSAAVSLLVALVVLAGSVGWVVRDAAARHAKTVADLQTALDDAQRARGEGKWPQAQAAAKRAEALLGDGAADADLADRVRTLLRELADEVADAELVARLEELRLLQAEVNVKTEHFADESAIGDYRRAFAGYGLRAGATAPEEAAARLRGRPPAVRATLVAALDHWLILARCDDSSEAGWLERVLSAADPDDWRQRLRAARRDRDGEALRRLAREVDVATQPPQSLFLLECALGPKGATEPVVAMLRRAQEVFPGDFWINHDLGRALEHCQPPQYGEAIRYLTAAVALRPQSAGVRLNLGVAFLNAGRFDEAVATFRQAVELKHDYAMAHHNLGAALFHKGRLDEAIAAWHRAAELRPDSVMTHTSLGTTLCQMGRFDEAAAAWGRVVELKPADADARCNLGFALWKLRRLDEAGAAFRKTIELKPDYADAHFNLGSVQLAKGRFEEAVTALSRAIEIKPDHAGAHANLGCALWKLGRRDEAIAAYREAIRLHPDIEGVHCNLGAALTAQGRLDDAVTAYRQAAALKPDHAETRCELGCVLWRLGRLDEAGDCFRKVIALKPDYADAHYNLGNVHLGKGQFEEAVIAYRRALGLNADLAEAHCNLGHALREQGAFAAALDELKRGHELGSRSPDWPYPSGGWVRECRRLVELDGRLPSVLKGEAQPAAAERKEYAYLCSRKKLYAASARLWARAFADDPKLADDLCAGHRYYAACAAALAAAGRGKDAGGLGDAERVRWRKQALEWLRANLEANDTLLAGRKPEDCGAVRQRLSHWQADPDLAGLRDPAAVAGLPADEREAWRRLWADVEVLLARAAAR